MEPINNANAANYPVTMPQQEYANDYSNVPMAYDDAAYEDKKKAASNMSGLAILGTIGLVGAALWGGHAWGKKGAKNAIETAENAAKEALAKADVLKTEKNVLQTEKNVLQTEKDVLQKANDEAYKIAEEKYTTGFWGKGKLRAEIKKALKPEGKKAEEAAGNTTKKTENAADKASEAAKETADTAKETAENAS